MFKRLAVILPLQVSIFGFPVKRCPCRLFYGVCLVFNVVTRKMAILRACFSLSLEAVLSLVHMASYSERRRFRLSDGGEKNIPQY